MLVTHRCFLNFSFPSLIRPSRRQYRLLLQSLPQFSRKHSRMLTSFSSMNLKPSLPSSILNEFGQTLKDQLFLDIGSVEKELAIDQDQRDAFFRLSRTVNIQSHDLLQKLRNGRIEDYQLISKDIDENIQQLLVFIGNSIVERENRMTNLMEKALIPKFLYHFYQTGQLLPVSAIAPTPTDTEYLLGVISFASELSQYTINRACQFDFPSIQLSKDIISEIFQILLEFDFRNGILRRRYDSVKYSLKTIENIYYELNLQFQIPANTLLPQDYHQQPQRESLAASQHNEQADKPDQDRREGDPNHHSSTTDQPPASKKPRVSPTVPEEEESATTNSKYHYLCEAEFVEILQRMNEYDQAREFIIKESRDIQKAAKQSIYAIFRQQYEEARKKLNFCQKKGEMLHRQVIEKYPTLRQGSFTNSLEEYSEGELLYHWILHHQLLLPRDSALPPYLTTLEYINGLADFTGEIGRFAVKYASERKLLPIQEIQQLDQVIYDYLLYVATASGNTVSNTSLGKKMEMVYQNLKKLDDILYELHLLEKTGKRYHLSTAPTTGNTGSRGKEKDEQEEQKDD